MRRPSWLGRQILKAIGMEDESFWSTWSPLGPTTAKGTSQMARDVGDGLTLDVIMSPVLWIARRMAESDIAVVTVEDENDYDHKHPLARLMRRPNPWYAGSTMRMALAVNYLMDGNAYCRKVRGGNGGVIGLIYLPSWSIEPIATSDAYQYSSGATVEIIPATEIVHLRFGIDPAYVRKGLSPLKILLRELYTDLQGATMTAMLMKNAGIMGVVISPKEGVVIQKAGETKKYIQDEFTGVRAGAAMVMTAPTDVTYFGADATKMDLSVLRAIPEERICALLSIPAAVVGFGTGMEQTKVGATLQELRAMAYEDCIIPTQNSWCDELDIQLLPDFEQNAEDYSTQFDNTKVRVLQPDENAIAKRHLDQLTNGGITLAEYREELGLETTSAQDVFYIPSSFVVTPEDDLIPPEPPAPVVVPPVGGAVGGVQGEAAPQAAQQKEFKVALHGAARLTPKISRYMHRLLSNGRKEQRAWEPKLTRELKAYGTKVGEAFKSVAERRELKTAEDEWDAAGAEAAMIVQADNIIAPLKASYREHYLHVARDTYEAINTAMGLGVNLTDAMEKAILQKGGRRLGLLDLSDETKQAMFDAIKEARAAGEGVAGIVDRIADMVGRGRWTTAEMRAEIIARTETKYAQNWSSLEAYQGSDTVTDVLIFDAQLGPTDEECEAINGETVGMEEAIRLMEMEHPNGTRSFAPVVR